VVLAREAKWAAQGSGPLVTSLCFGCAICPPRSQGARRLCHNGVNMTKLESYMSTANFFATQFLPTSTATRMTAGLPLRRGTEVLLARIPHRRRLSRPPFRATFSETRE